MPNATVRANAQAMPRDIEADLRRDRFDEAYREFLAARADVYAQHDENDQEAADARSRRAELAELSLIAARAPHGWALMQKWDVVEAHLAKEVEGGQEVYPVTILGLAALKADVLAIGLKS